MALALTGTTEGSAFKVAPICVTLAAAGHTANVKFTNHRTTPMPREELKNATLFKMMTGVNMQHVTYRGAGPALTLLEAGAALAAGKRVFVVSPDWWSFANHPRCRVLKDVASAIEAIMGKESGRRCNSVEVASGGKSYQGKSAGVADTRVARTASQCSKQAVSKRQISKSNRDVVASSISAAEADRWCRFDVLSIPKFRKVKTVGAWRPMRRAIGAVRVGTRPPAGPVKQPAGRDNP